MILPMTTPTNDRPNGSTVARDEVTIHLPPTGLSAGAAGSPAPAPDPSNCFYMYFVMSDLDHEEGPFHAAGDRCWKKAKFEIYARDGLETQACEEHVGALLGTATNDGPENERWTVVLLSVSTTERTPAGRSK